MSRYAAQGLGSILDIAEARVREVDAELDRAEALIFCATEGADLAPPHENTSTAPLATGETGGRADPSGEGGDGNGLIHPSEQGEFRWFKFGLWTGLGLGFCIGGGTALVIFVASQIVIGWFS